MSDDDLDEMKFWIPLAIITFIFGAWVGYSLTDRTWRNDIVQHNMAHYKVNDDGVTVFTYGPKTPVLDGIKSFQIDKNNKVKR